MLNYRPNEQRQLGGPLKKLSDEVETCLSRPNWSRMIMMIVIIICSLVSKYFFQTRENRNISHVELYVTSKFSVVVDGTQTLQGKLCARAHSLVHITHYTYMLTYVITNKGQAITFLTVIQGKHVRNVGWDTTYPDLFIAGFPYSLQSNTEIVPHLGHYLFLPLSF
jgi:hypothetical protein